MGVKLYAMDFSPPSRACIMACEIFGVPFKKIAVNLFENEHLAPEFLKKNPLHTIPVLEDWDLILYDRYPKTSTWLENFKVSPYAKKYNEKGAKILYGYINNCLTS